MSSALSYCGHLSETRHLSYVLVLLVSLAPCQKVRNMVLRSSVWSHESHAWSLCGHAALHGAG